MFGGGGLFQASDPGESKARTLGKKSFRADGTRGDNGALRK